MKEIIILRWSEIIGCIILGLFVGLSVKIFVTYPTCKPKLTFQQKQVADIKLCTDNGLQAHQGETGRYYCKP